MKNLQFNLYQCGAGRVGSKKSKPIATPPRGAGLNSRPIPVSPPLRGRENLHRAKQESEERRVKRGGAKLPSLVGICITPHFTTFI